MRNWRWGSKPACYVKTCLLEKKSKQAVKVLNITLKTEPIVIWDTHSLQLKKHMQKEILWVLNQTEIDIPPHGSVFPDMAKVSVSICIVHSNKTLAYMPNYLYYYLRFLTGFIIEDLTIINSCNLTQKFAKNPKVLLTVTRTCQYECNSGW